MATAMNVFLMQIYACKSLNLITHLPSSLPPKNDTSSHSSSATAFLLFFSPYSGSAKPTLALHLMCVCMSCMMCDFRYPLVYRLHC